MLFSKPNSVQQTVALLTQHLGITSAYLWASLSVDGKTLYSRKENIRLTRLYEVAQEIERLRPGLTGPEILLVIENGDVKLTKEAAWKDLKALPLMEHICAWPEETEWRAKVEQALVDYENCIT